ncbi:MAG TPA: SDR family oxidoreductase, partial [Sphingomicrobium sp.]|nr:SDR family oxidoreductase [Sphingomicrobium sp.]
ETKAARFYPVQQFELAIQINLIGTFRCIANCAFGMVDLDPVGPDGERGVIINTASVAAEDGQIGQAAYSASKGGVLAMGLPIARDLMNDGIRVNTILPGVFKTPMVAMMPPNVQDALGAQVPFPKRLGEAEEYARLACFLIENSYMNAAAVRLDGGIRMAPR